MVGILLGVGIALFSAAFDPFAFAGFSQDRYFLLFWFFLFVLLVSSLGYRESERLLEPCAFAMIAMADLFPTLFESYIYNDYPPSPYTL